MAIKPTIYKIRVSLSDLNRDYYDTLSLTLAQHPSETLERMMARVLAYCINAETNLSFTKGLSSVDEPDIWLRELDDSITLWIDVGEPSLDRVKKSSRSASTLKVYSFNSKSDVWWQQDRNKFITYNASYFQFQWSDIQLLASLVERTMDCSITITGESAFIATNKGECEVTWKTLT